MYHFFSSDKNNKYSKIIWDWKKKIMPKIKSESFKVMMFPFKGKEFKGKIHHGNSDSASLLIRHKKKSRKFKGLCQRYMVK